MVGGDVLSQFAEAEFAVLPLGSLEWHGPHLPLGSDSIIAEGFAGELDEGPWSAVRYPTIWFTAVPGQTRHYPGTVGIRPDHMVSYIVQVLEQIHRTGIERILLLNAHDANMATARAAMEWVSGELPVSLLLVNWFQLLTPGEVADVLGDGPVRGHGGAVETAAVMAFAPELVRLEGVEDLPPRPRLATAQSVLVESHPSPWQGWSGYVGGVTAGQASSIRTKASDALRRLVTEWLERPDPEPSTTGVPHA